MANLFMNNARALLARLMEEDDDSSSDEEGNSRVQPQDAQRLVAPAAGTGTMSLVVDLTASDDARDEEEEDARHVVRGGGGDADTDEDKEDDDETSGSDDLISMTSASGIGSRFRGIIVDDDHSDEDSDSDDEVFDVTPTTGTTNVLLPPLVEAVAVPSPNRVGRKRSRNEMVSQENSSDVVVVETKVVFKPQPTECTICIDACTLAGPHRLVALKCGHLFGKLCIERWVLTRKACPICNCAVRKPDIRALFSDHVAVVDNAGISEMTEKYESEKAKRIQLESTLAQTKQQLLEEIQDHRREALRMKEELSLLQANSAAKTAQPPPKSKPRWK